MLRAILSFRCLDVRNLKCSKRDVGSASLLFNNDTYDSYLIKNRLYCLHATFITFCIFACTSKPTNRRRSPIGTGFHAVYGTVMRRTDVSQIVITATRSAAAN